MRRTEVPSSSRASHGVFLCTCVSRASPSVLILSAVLTRANSVALNITVPSLFRGMFIDTRRCGKKKKILSDYPVGLGQSDNMSNCCVCLCVSVCLPCRPPCVDRASQSQGAAVFSAAESPHPGALSSPWKQHRQHRYTPRNLCRGRQTS